MTDDTRTEHGWLIGGDEMRQEAAPGPGAPPHGSPDPTHPGDPLVALVADALLDTEVLTFHSPQCWVMRSGPCNCPARDVLGKRAAAILAHPDLRARLELGMAWEAAEKALPEGWRLEYLCRSGMGGEPDDWWHVLAVEPYTEDGTSHEGEQAICEGHGPTPVEALRSVALNAARLTEGGRS